MTFAILLATCLDSKNFHVSASFCIDVSYQRLRQAFHCGAPISSRENLRLEAISKHDGNKRVRRNKHATGVASTEHTEAPVRLPIGGIKQ